MGLSVGGQVHEDVSCDGRHGICSERGRSGENGSGSKPYLRVRLYSGSYNRKISDVDELRLQTDRGRVWQETVRFCGTEGLSFENEAQ